MSPVLSRAAGAQGGIISNSGFKRTFLGRQGGASGYQISRSLRFNSSDSTYLSRTPGSAGNRKTWTWAGWVKLCGNSTTDTLLSGYSGGNETVVYVDNNTRQFVIYDYQSGYNVYKVTTAIFRDASAWYHVVVSWDTDNATAEDRVRLYINGSRVTTFSTNTNPSSGFSNGLINSTNVHQMGRFSSTSSYSNFYLADVHFIDGSALTPSSFTETDAITGQLIPKTFSGSYGSQGWRLTFSDNSGTTATTLGKDSSPNGNNWTPNNLSVTSTPIYSGTASGTFDYGYYKPSNMWTAAGASNTSNSQTAGTTSSSGGYGTSIYFDLSSKNISATSVDLWILKDNNMGNYAPKIEINGTDITPSVLTTGYSWVGISGISQLTSIRVPAGAYCGAVRINGTTFIEGLTTDSLVDSPTGYGTDTGAGAEVRGNYCTLNPLDKHGSFTLSNGNLDGTTSGGYYHANATIFPSSGKYYFEMLLSRLGGNGGVALANTLNTASDFSGSKISLNGWSGGYQVYVGATYNNVSGFTSANANDILKLAYDSATGEVWLGVNEYWITNTYSRQTSFPSTATGTVTTPVKAQAVFYNIDGSFNFGQRSWVYAPPSGYKALCSHNLPEPTILKGNTAFDVALYTGNGSTQTISGLAFSPDLVWVKARSSAYENMLADTNRGGDKTLSSNLTRAEATGGITGFTSDGFSLNSLYNGVSDPSANGNGTTFAAWCWDMGGSTVTNTNGSISSQVRASATNGCSVVTYTGTGSNITVGHGLGAAPSFYVVKARTAVDAWYVYHSSLGNTKYLRLNATNAESTLNVWNNAGPTSTTFSVGSANGPATNGTDYVAYCFTPISGFSAIGIYTGNGSSDGPMVFTGFRPRWVLTKRTDSTSDWELNDSARSPYNVVNDQLYPNYSVAEDVDNAVAMDYLSNGFRIRNTISQQNASGGTYLYIAFAESPFKYSRAR